MSHRSAKYVNKPPEAHVKESNRDHEWNHGNQRKEPVRGLRTSPTHPPDGEVAHAGLAGVGGVIGPRTRDTDYTRFTGGSLNVERLKTATAAGATNESTKRFCIIDSGAGTSTGPAPAGTEKGRRPATIEYCTDVVWLAKDEGLRVQAAQGEAVRATAQAKWIVAWHVQGGRVECMCVKVNLVPGSHFWMLATGTHGIGHKGSNLDFHGNHQNSGKPAIVDMTTNTAYPLGEKWGVPTISMIPLSEELKAEVAGILTG